MLDNGMNVKNNKSETRNAHLSSATDLIAGEYNRHDGIFSTECLSFNLDLDSIKRPANKDIQLFMQKTPLGI